MNDEEASTQPAGPVPRPFSVVVGDVPEPAALLTLDGEMDMAAIRTFRAGVDQAMGDRDVRTLVLDMSGVSFMDSSMLRELLRLNQELRQRGAWPVLAGLQGPVRRLLDLTRTAELFRLAESPEAAVQRAGGG